jgi:trimethylamine--corrinoid protein Co-methyltransferase
LAGANLIYGIGMIDSALAWDYASALLQNEFLDMVLKVVNGIQVNEETIAYEVIKDVGPAGEFITHEHTLSNFSKMSKTSLMDRRSRDQWEASGSPDIVEKAYEKSMDILENAKSEPRSEKVQKELDDIYAEFEQRIAERKAREESSKK